MKAKELLRPERRGTGLALAHTTNSNSASPPLRSPSTIWEAVGTSTPEPEFTSNPATRGASMQPVRLPYGIGADARWARQGRGAQPIGPFRVEMWAWPRRR